MSLSNRDRIERLFDTMAPALDAYLTRVCVGVLPEGKDWTLLLAARDAKNGITNKVYSRTDPQNQIRVLTEHVTSVLPGGQNPFASELGHSQRNYASELRATRNAWAHMAPFTDDDAYRALDTGERLLRDLAQPEAADRIQRLRLDLRRVTAEKDDKRTLKAAVPTLDSAGLKPWREVLRPHDDVATGNFQAAEFAADLHTVAHDHSAGRDYADPVAFFERTYLTEGLRDLIGKGLRRLAGDPNATPVINLQTNFGGGKTHSMLALWHLADDAPLGDLPQDVQELVIQHGYQDLTPEVARAALVGNHIAATGSVKADGTTVNTLWGELAWQLGGSEGFAIVADADRQSTPPGAALHELLARYAPCVILIDEWVAYARTLVGRQGLPGGTFDDQFTFAQSLTEAAKATPGVLLAISIPASERGEASASTEEVGGAHGLEALSRLQNVVRRVAEQWRPATAVEAYHIVRQRLFVTPDGHAQAFINATARAFAAEYRKHPEQFPAEALRPEYEDQIRRTYPVHPEFFDRLYEDWSTLERFQRTRGVLRLMNTVVHALWQGEDASPLIMPGSIPLATSAVNCELTQYLPDSWKSIIDADVDGPTSEPAQIDAASPVYGQRHLAKRLARTVFFGAAPTVGSAHKGLETKRVYLGMFLPGDTIGNFHTALGRIADQTTYFYAGDGRYWYDLQANITRRAKDQAARFHPEDVSAEIAGRLRGESKATAAFAGVHVCPDEHGDIPDSDEAKLVLVHPKHVHHRGAADSTAIGFAAKAAQHCGASQRRHRNMVVFLAADDVRMEEVDRAVREHLAWKDVRSHHAELDLTQNQCAQADAKIAETSRVIDDRLKIAYQWVLIPTGQPVTIEATRVDGAANSLTERVTKRLTSDGVLCIQRAAATIRYDLEHTPARKLWEDGHVSVGELWRMYAEYPYMPRLRDRHVLETGLLQQPLLWQAEGIALADGHDEETGRYRHLRQPTDLSGVTVTSDTLIVHPDRAARQAEQDLMAVAGDSDHSPSGKPDIHWPDGPGTAVLAREDVTPPEPALQHRFYGSKELDHDRYVADFKRIVEEVLLHLQNTPGGSLHLRLEIDATSQDGFDTAKIRTIMENAKTLKFDDFGFEKA